MGIFSDRCINESCHGRVPKTARFCRVCGAPAPDADTNCGRCGVVVSTSSRHCWNCGVDLAEMRKPKLFANRWVREPDDFAVRLDEWDVKGFLTKGLIVDHGTAGLVFQQGRFCGSIDGGSYDMNGFLRKLNHFNQTTPTAVVLVEAGDVELHMEGIRLRSREQLEVDAIFKAVVRLKDPEQFFTNAFKGRNHLTVGYLANSLMDELRGALQTYVGARPVADLYSNTNLRRDVEQQMQSEMEPLLQRIGLEMVLLRFVDFFCPQYDPIRQEEAQLYVDTRHADVQIDRLKLTQRMRKSLTTEKMDALKTEKDLEDFVRQTEHELGIKDVIRADEMDRLKREFAFTRDKAVLLQEIEIAGIRDEHERNRIRANLIAKIENETLEHRAGLEKKLAEARNEAETRRIRLEVDRLESEQDFWEAEKAVELRKKSQLVELEVQEKRRQIEAKTLEDRTKASAQALLSILDGPAADRILQLEQFRIKEKLAPDQLVAMAAADDPHMAHALAEKYKAEAAMSDERFKQLQEFMAKQEAVSRESADRLERVMNVSLEQMGMTATTRAQAPFSSQTVVAPGAAGGPPIVVNPRGGAEPKPCPKCRQIIPADSRFCPHCREKLF
ncbi:MAG: hypothetical protein JW955_04425 [Sedimentisphaerales bacterium]|nr:hypothetical protein [Sedimentisphaerales bacterium]